MSFPFHDVGVSVLWTAPQVIFNPALGVRFVFYWTMVYFVFSQYRKTARLQSHLYGKPRGEAWRFTVGAILEGLIVGIVGSYLMTFVGVSFLPDGSGLIWVLGVALLLMLVNARFMCFSYAGGLVSLSSLLFGFPKVSVASLMGLVAILHLMESLLIFINGAADATPVYIERGGRQVGAFYLQRSWPVPVALLILAVVSPLEAAGGINMPGWWPLLRTSPEVIAHPGAVFFLHALPAALGYGDMAVTCHPGVKARRTATNLAAYSLVLLILSIAATRYRPVVWAAALFGPLGHEAVVRWGNWREAKGRPYFVRPERGVMVLDAVPRSKARQLGFGPGWVITEINGRALAGRDHLEEELRLAGEAGKLTLLAVPPASRCSGAASRAGKAARARFGGGPRRVSTEFTPGDSLGIIPVPEEGDDMGLVMTAASPALTLARRLLRRPRPGK